MHKYNIENLKPFKSNWKNQPTKLIRIPESLADNILDYAHKLDNGIISNHSLVTENIEEFILKIDSKELNITTNVKFSLIIEKIKELSIKINTKEKGYKSNSASQLIKDIQQLINEVN